MAPRSTADTIALILTAVVSVVVVATALVLLAVEVRSPDQDTTGAADAIGRIVSTVIAVLAGFLAGRKMNGNGR